MELAAGFRSSLAGQLPDDWLLPSAESLVEPSAPIRYGVVQVGRHHSSGTPIVAIKHVKLIGRVEHHRAHPDVESPYTRSRIAENDVLISIKGTIGRVGVVPHGFEGNIARELARIRLKAGFCAAYVAHQLESDRTQARIHGEVVGTTRLEFSIATLRHFVIPIPPTLEEQRAIANALSDVDALLDGLGRLIAKKRDLKTAAMQQLLTGKTRLPGFAGDWITKPLSGTVEIRSGGTPSTARADFWNGYIPWCTPTDITALKGHKYLAATERTISESGLRASSAELIPPHSVIMTSRATIGECAINTLPLTTNQGFKNLIPTGVNGEFLFYLMVTQKTRLVQLCGGSTFLEIGKKQLAQFEIRLPGDVDEQKAMAKLLTDMDAEIDALERRRAKTHDLKIAMMQELLTGKTRLVPPGDTNDPATPSRAADAEPCRQAVHG